MADSNFVQPNPSIPPLQNQQDANRQASTAESFLEVVVQYPNASLPQSNPSMVPSPNPVSVQPPPGPQYTVVLTKPHIPFQYINASDQNFTRYLIWPPPLMAPPPPPNHDSYYIWAQPNPPTMAPPSPNHDSNCLPQPILPMAGSNHNLKETQQSPSEAQPTQLKSARSPSPSPIQSPSHPKNQPSTLPESLPIPQIRGSRKTNVAHKAANLANLLPTGTVLVFQALIPSLTANGKCHIFNKYLVGFVIAFCAATCFLSSFTDSFEYEEKLYYGFATCKGLCVLKYEDRTGEEEKIKKELGKYKIEPRDFVHAFGSLFVFLIFAISSPDVLACFFPEADSENEYSIVIYLPLVAGVLSSFLFSVCPTERKGFGYAGGTGRRP